MTILGTEEADDLRGSNQRDVILALGGDDRVDGRGGNDVICGGAGRDLIKGGPGHDKVFGGGDGRSEQRNADGVRLMVGDVVQGGPGDDLIDLGYDERQKTFGSAQRDRLSYKGSAFRVIVTLGTPKGRGHARGDGRDLLVKHPFLALLGSDKGDELTGSPYGDQILGRGGPDHVIGGGGRDVLVDGPIGVRVGDDVLEGGIGRDDADVVRRPRRARRRLLGRRAHRRARARRPAEAGRRTGRRRPLRRRDAGGVVRRWQRAAEGTTSWCRPWPARCTGPRWTSTFASARSACAAGAATAAVRSTRVETLTLDNEFGTAQRLRWFVRGTSAVETVVLRHGGSVLATMAGGDDRVVGSSGDDNLKGGPGDDRLFGGSGKDIAIGGPGTDTCRKVEFKKGCELPS